MKYAYYNDSYKKLLHLARTLDLSEPKDIFKKGGMIASNSQLQAWRVGVDHKNFRPISEDQLLSFIDGLISEVADRKENTVTAVR
jgi:uncharacterized protein YehS (DUF1456 family)